MTIYLTPFDPQTKRATAPSADSGFLSLQAAVACFGPGHLTLSQRAAVYPNIMLSDYPVRLPDAPAN